MRPGSALLVAALGVGVVALSPAGREGPLRPARAEATVAVIGPLTGRASAYGVSQRQGAELAAREVNARGGAGGALLRLVAADDGAEQTRAGALARDLVLGERVAAIVGAINSDCTHQIEMVCVKLHVPQITTASTDPSITDTGSPWIFRCLADDVLQAKALLRRLLAANPRRLALLSQNNRYGRMGIAEVARAARAAGVPVVLEEGFESGTTDFGALAARAVAAAPDAIVLWSLYREGAEVVRALREAGVTATLYAGDGLAAPEFIRLAGEAAEGAIITFPFDPEAGEPARDFVRRFTAAYGQPPDSFAAHGHDAILCLASAAERAGGWDRAALRAALAATDHLPGATGPLAFDATGNDARPVKLARVASGRFVVIPEE